MRTITAPDGARFIFSRDGLAAYRDYMLALPKMPPMLPDDEVRISDLEHAVEQLRGTPKPASLADVVTALLPPVEEPTP